MQERFQEERTLSQSHYALLTDQEIVRIAQFGNEQAAEYLLYKYRSLVRTKVRSYFLMGAEKEISFLSFARICIERHVITAIKTATRRKQTPLNTSVSLEYPSDDSDSEWNLADILVSDDTVDPEELVLKREDNGRLQDMLRRLLSDFEWRVLSGYQVGKSYREIACELQCKTKSVDNALARIKRKISLAPHAWPGITDNN